MIRRLEAALAGWPDAAMTAAILVLAGFGILVALYAPRSAKLALLLWWVLP